MRYEVHYLKRNLMRDSYTMEPKFSASTHDKVITLKDGVCGSLEDVFRIMNVVDGSDFEIPQKLGIRSMCVGDVVIDQTSKKYFCAGMGWKEVV